jgi:hypothetical protein
MPNMLRFLFPMLLELEQKFSFLDRHYLGLLEYESMLRSPKRTNLEHC